MGSKGLVSWVGTASCAHGSSSSVYMFTLRCVSSVVQCRVSTEHVVAD